MRSILPILLIVIMLASCEKAGTGGKAQLNVHVMRKSTETAVPEATVYIKYNANEFPGDSPGNYDASVTTDKAGYVEFNGLRRGNYYLYATSLDTATGIETSGGIYFDIENKTGERDIVIETKP